MPNKRGYNLVTLVVQMHAIFVVDGIIVERGKMLHCERGKDSVIEDYTRPAWVHRIRGIYRHDHMMEWTHSPFAEWVSVEINEGACGN